MKFKNTIVIVLSLILCVSLFACKAKTVSSSTNTTVSTTSKEETTTQKESDTTTTKEIITTTKEIITTTIKDTETETKTDEDPTTQEITTTMGTTSSSTTQIIHIDTTTKSYSEFTPTSSSNIAEYYKDFDFDSFLDMSVSNRIDYIHDYIYVVLSGQSYASAKIYFYKTDENPETGKIQLFYTHEEVSADAKNEVSFGSSKGTINREHVWPQSLGDSKNEQGGYDLHHIRPTIYESNEARGNKVYGNVAHNASNAQYYNNKLYAYMTSSTFEPVDDVKGDVARIVFYYSIVYNYDLRIIVSDDTFNEILEWNRIDPVSDVEINRNNAVYEIQGNRNIFIDYPELAEYIWNN